MFFYFCSCWKSPEKSLFLSTKNTFIFQLNNFLRIVFFSVRFEMENIDKNSDKFWFPFWESISTTFQVNQLHLFLKSHKDYYCWYKSICVDPMRIASFFFSMIKNKFESIEWQDFDWKYWKKYWKKKYVLQIMMVQRSIKKCQTTFKILNFLLMSINVFFHVTHFTF